MNHADMSSGTRRLIMEEELMSIEELSVEEERLFACFNRWLIEKSVAACPSGIGAFVVKMLDRVCVPAIILDRHGSVAEMNARARALFGSDVNVKNNRFCIRDREASLRLWEWLDEMVKPVQSKSLIAEAMLIQRHDKGPLVLRAVPFKEPMQQSEQEVQALVTLTACRPDANHPQRSSQRIFVV
jgi:hypothetical protein